MKDRNEAGRAFTEAYNQLNEAQKEAVNAIEGPVMVIAGPGTGKTQILALRIANILQQTDTRPENILALTFTDSGSHAMRERLRRYIGDDAYHVAIHTFHSFAGELIRKYPDSYPHILGGRPINDIERLDLLDEILSSGQFPALRPPGDPLYYVKKLPGAISDLKKEYITPDLFAERISQLEETLANEPKFHEKGAHKGKVRGPYIALEKRINKLREVLGVYKLYQAALRDKHLFDFEDMILETVSALSQNEDMLRDLQETYQYLLADEHQDVNQAQNKILELLADYHDQPNIFVVGDEKQAIYRFQGASLDNFLFFQDRFKGTKVISLTDNYRSNQHILDTGHSLIETDNPELAKLRIPLKASGKNEKGKQELRNFSHQAIEDEWIVDTIEETLTAGIPPEEIAIITRYNRDVEHLATLLRSRQINVKPSAEGDILSHPVTKAVENLLGAVLKIGDESVLFDCLLGTYWEIPAGDLARVFSSRSSAWPLYRLISDTDKLAELNVTTADKILNVSTVLNDARAKVSATAPHLLLHDLLQKSGLLDQLIKDNPIENGRVLRRLYDDIEAMVITNQAVTLNDVVRQLEQRRLHNLPLIAPFVTQGEGAVQVMTAHKSKGLEFDTVIIPYATDRSFGKTTQVDYFKLPLLEHDPLPAFTAEDDEKRLLYVAMTRAKRNLLISASESDSEGKLSDLSRFLIELPEDSLNTIETELEDNEFDPTRIFAGEQNGFQLEPSLLKELFLNRGLSVTHLNNYLEDPIKYYYENLLRKPHPRGLSLLRGEAVHSVLERVVGKLRQGEDLPKTSEVSDLLNQALDRLPLGQADTVRMHETALEALVGYLPQMANNVDEHSLTEYGVKVALETDDTELPEIPLTGNLDRLDRAEDGKIIRVVDYKTGKPKSRNDIEGNTKSSNGNYKRQLVFYALLLQIYEPEKLQEKTEFVLSFVEPKPSGEVVEHSFTITQTEIDELKEAIKQVAKEIVSGEKF